MHHTHQILHQMYVSQWWYPRKCLSPQCVVTAGHSVHLFGLKHLTLFLVETRYRVTNNVGSVSQLWNRLHVIRLFLTRFLAVELCARCNDFSVFCRFFFFFLSPSLSVSLLSNDSRDCSLTISRKKHKCSSLGKY